MERSARRALRDPDSQPSLAKAGSEWSAAEVDELRQLAMRRLKAATIAGMLGRTPAAVRGKAANCGIDIVSDRAIEPIVLRRLRSLEAN